MVNDQRVRRWAAAVTAMAVGWVVALVVATPAQAAGQHLTNPATGRCLMKYNASYAVWIMPCQGADGRFDWIQIGTPPRVMLQTGWGTPTPYCLTNAQHLKNLILQPCNPNDERQYWTRSSLWPEPGRWSSGTLCLDARILGPTELRLCDPWGDSRQQWSFP